MNNLIKITFFSLMFASVGCVKAMQPTKPTKKEIEEFNKREDIDYMYVGGVLIWKHNKNKEWKPDRIRDQVIFKACKKIAFR